MDAKTVETVICEFGEANAGPVQGTPEWKQIRWEKINGKVRIGGSEIGSLLGLNKYESKASFLDAKANGKLRATTLPCSFGHMFEDVCIEIFEENQMLTVHCRGLSLVDTYIEGLMYSPDGIAAMPIDTDNNLVLYGMYDSADYKISHYEPVLIEIKCPISRVPDGEIPVQYVSQLQTGMMCIPILQRALFIDNIFRFCSVADYNAGNSSFSTDIHKNPLTDVRPLRFGTILIYSLGFDSSDSEINPDMIQYAKKTYITGSAICDFGASRYNIVMKLFDALDKEIIIGKRSDNYTEPIIDIEDKHNLIGILCWKYFGSFMTEETYDHDYIEKIKEGINEYFEYECDDD